MTHHDDEPNTDEAPPAVQHQLAPARSSIESTLAGIPDDVEDELLARRASSGSVMDVNRSEIETQIDAAHRHPRSTKRFLRQAMNLATITKEVAESCIYTLPKKKKDKNGRMVPITGPSVRMAEICASSYGNLHVGARPVDVGRQDVTSQGVAWDLESNFRVTIEAKRRITNKEGERYGEDMVLVTQAAATSIAFRNAIFRVIPRSYIDTIYEEVRKVAVGGAKTLVQRRQEVLDGLGRLGISPERAFEAVGAAGPEDVGLNELEALIGFGTAIKTGGMTANEAFPEPGAATIPEAKAGEQGRRISLGKRRETTAQKDPEPTKKPAPAAPPAPAQAAPAADTKPAEDQKEDRGDDPSADYLRRQPPSAAEELPSWAK